MMDDETKAAQAYLNEARPEAEPHGHEASQKWLYSNDREAKGLRAALRAIQIMGPAERESEAWTHGDGCRDQGQK